MWVGPMSWGWGSEGGGVRDGGRSVRMPMKEDDKRKDDWMMQEIIVKIWLCESMRE